VPGLGEIATVEQHLDQDKNFLYQWDAFNRLRTVRDRVHPEVVIAQYAYDAHPAVAGGRRVQKSVFQRGSLDGVTRFYYDGAHSIEERVLTGAAERVSHQFVFGAQPDEVHALDIDTNGVPREQYTYDWRGAPGVLDPAAGTPVSTAGALSSLLFTGQRFDPESGLYYFKARYYDPAYGVFLSRDPAGIWHDPANHGNPMAYAGNNPLNGRDPSGLSLWKRLFGLGQEARQVKG